MKKKNVLALVVGDMHLRNDQPIGRRDLFKQTQIRKLLWLKNLHRELGKPPVFSPGDLFHRWRSEPELERVAIDLLPQPFVCVPGNHDLPYHNSQNLHLSSYSVLAAAGRIQSLGCPPTCCNINNMMVIGCGHGDPLPLVWETPKGYKATVAILHTMVWTEGALPYPDAPERLPNNSAEKLLARLAQFDLLVTGDNHHQFTARKSRSDRLLINAGSFVRMTANQLDHRPAVYVWHGGSEYTRYEIPVVESDIDRQHIEKKLQRDQRISSFVQELKSSARSTLSFRRTMRRYLDSNKVDKEVEELIWRCLDEKQQA